MKTPITASASATEYLPLWMVSSPSVAAMVTLREGTFSRPTGSLPAFSTLTSSSISGPEKPVICPLPLIGWMMPGAERTRFS